MLCWELPSHNCAICEIVVHGLNTDDIVSKDLSVFHTERSQYVYIQSYGR